MQIHPAVDRWVRSVVPLLLLSLTLGAGQVWAAAPGDAAAAAEQASVFTALAANTSEEVGIITTYAGGGVGSGPATTLSQVPKDVAVFGDYVYIADSFHDVVRRLETSTGIEAVVAGIGGGGYSGDGGPATSAQLNYPSGVAVDLAGNLYIADTYNNRIRKVDTSGIITTVAGNGVLAIPGTAGRPPARNLHGLPS